MSAITGQLECPQKKLGQSFTWCQPDFGESSAISNSLLLPGFAILNDNRMEPDIKYPLNYHYLHLAH